MTGRTTRARRAFLAAAVAAAAAFALPLDARSPDIHDAALKGDLDQVRALVLRDPSLVNAEKAPNAKTPLHYAAQEGHVPVVAFLLDQGAQVNRPNIAGETPLHYAVSLDSPETVALLIARGADVNAKTEDGRTPLQMAAAWRQMGSIRALLDKGADARQVLPGAETLLHVVALLGPPEAIALFASRGVPADSLNAGGATPLLVACAAGNVATAKALLEQGADPNLRDGSGRQPLVLAARSGDADLVRRLLDAGAKVTDGSTSDKRSALHVAAAAGHGRIVSLLLAKGADRGALDSQGRTPVDLAARYGNTRIVQSLGGGRGLAGASGKTSSARRLLARPPKTGQAVVWYLGHSGWAVRTTNHLLVFDYARSGGLPDDPSLANGMLVPAEIRDVPVTVFITHDHADHYAPAVFDLRGAVRQITYVAGFRPEGKDGYIEMVPRQTKTLGSLEVTAIESTDAGVGYFVRADGLTLFHGGDHCNPQGEAGGLFKREVDFLAARGLTADLYFAAARGCGQPEGIRKGVFYAIDRLSAKAVFPMHGGGREAAYADLARDAGAAGLHVPFHCAEFGGDHYTVPTGAPRPRGGEAATPPAENLGEVLRCAGEVVVRQARESTVILADETCRQSAYKEVAATWGAAEPMNGSTARTARRQWKAELALVQIPSSGQPAVPWLEIRDVVEVDGKPLPDRVARLERLTRADPNWTSARAREIVKENARYNLGAVHRTINAPTIPLLVLHPTNQSRFTFGKAGEQKVGGVIAWKVGFREDRSPTLVRAADTGIDMPANGTFWIDPATGEVLRAEMECGAFSESRLSVTYRRHPRFGLSLPVEMIEKATGNDGEWVDGKCDYTNYRRFETSGRLILPK